MLNEAELIQELPMIKITLKNRDHFDIKCISSGNSFKLFNHKLLSYHPAWVQWLYKIREGLLTLLKIPYPKNFEPLYKTVASVDDHYWLGVISDSHLTAHFGVLKQEMPGETALFHVFSIVHYHGTAGKIYFNLIRPFHHLVVHFMIKEAAKS